MLKKKISAIFIICIFILSSIFLIPQDKNYRVQEVLSPVEFALETGVFKYDDLDSFDSKFTQKNKILAQKLNITEQEAFVFGNLGNYWADKLMKGRSVFINDEKDLIYLKFSYRDKFYYSGFCLEGDKPCYKDGFEKVLNNIRKTNYKVMDLDSETVYDISDTNVRNLNNFIVVRKSHLPKHAIFTKNFVKNTTLETTKGFGNIKIYFADSTSKLMPDRKCSSSICKEILSNINKSEKTIDMAIYGYSHTPEIETAFKNALKRGVKIRLVYDSDIKGGNIYPNTEIITRLIKNNRSDRLSPEAKNIMHNKFYIFDDKVLITGSANLSHTDMSGFNSNSIIVAESEEIAKIYKTEFEQMYSGRFHNDKKVNPHKIIQLNNAKFEVYFSPQDKSISNAVLPLINKSKKYIYIPTFVLTDKRVTEALISAKNRGVEVKIIIDALNASVQHSKHKELRAGGIEVKTENYAGKMHSKSMIVDDKYTIIGSMNFSNSGENRNDENLVVIDSEEIAKFYKQFFTYQWNKIDNKWLKLNARAEGKDSIGSCTDGLDNNYDGLTDSEDLACK